ncbi:hypothetical protein B0T21DRAFT_374119 [Apiosordaria backusii]|uniref:Uncharacterized protein n=1 Tax=Apiosordaria backusii TaxID=314023 RepID=A0AA40AN59_9PEZI|nr:hypothetical protein B0T21DRAFT_374119 [Apiosordaria backusii]
MEVWACVSCRLITCILFVLVNIANCQLGRCAVTPYLQLMTEDRKLHDVLSMIRKDINNNRYSQRPSLERTLALSLSFSPLGRDER